MLLVVAVKIFDGNHASSGAHDDVEKIGRDDPIDPDRPMKSS
jgi:hypothetical protein